MKNINLNLYELRWWDMNKCEETEHKTTEEITLKEYYTEIVELSAQFIEKHSYQRSGKSGVFYKYNSDKSKGYLIGFRKSIDNTPDFCSFHILFGNVSIDEVSSLDTCRKKIRLQDLKSILMNGYSPLDYGHELDEWIVKNENVNDYFQHNILPELKKIFSQLSLW